MVQRTVIDYIRSAAQTCPEKCAYFDESVRLTYGRLNNLAKCIATELIRKLNVSNRPIAVYMDKSPMTIAAFFGVMYSRNFYSPIDTGMPDYRLQLVMENLKPVGIVTDAAHYDVARQFCSNVFLIEEFNEEEINDELITKYYTRIIPGNIFRPFHL